MCSSCGNSAWKCSGFWVRRPRHYRASLCSDEGPSDQATPMPGSSLPSQSDDTVITWYRLQNLKTVEEGVDTVNTHQGGCKFCGLDHK